MSDVSDLHGIFPTLAAVECRRRVPCDRPSTRRPASAHYLKSNSVSRRRLSSTWRRRSRGYGLIKTGLFDMQLTPVGSPAPSWPGGEYKPAVGMWAWHPTYGEVRIETNAAIFMQALVNVWDQCRTSSEAMAGKQPVVRFVDRVSVTKKAIGKSFFSPVIEVAGWVPRDQVPGWANANRQYCRPRRCRSYRPRRSPLAAPGAKKQAKVQAKTAAKPGPNDPLADLGDDIPRK